VGIPDATKGESIWAFYVPRPGSADQADVVRRLTRRVAEEVGKPFAPSRVIEVRQLPKTRSQKILRRAVRAAVLGTEPGDLSGAENPESVEEIRRLIKELP
jgi:acetyl-CoA synthetase